MRKVVIVLSVATLIMAIACSKGSEGGGGAATLDCSGAAKSFATDVNPVIQSSCATTVDCHGAGSNNGVGPLLTYQQIFNGRIAIRSAVANGIMPKNSSLPASQKNAILCWIDNGAANN